MSILNWSLCNRLPMNMIFINQNNLLAGNSQMNSPPSKISDYHYSILPNDSIMKDLDDLIILIEGQPTSPLLNENIKYINSHAIDDDFIPLQLEQGHKSNAKRCLFPEFECEHLKYKLSGPSSSPLHGDIEELLNMSDFMDQNGGNSTTDESKGHLDMNSQQEDHQTVLPTRRCLLHEFEATNSYDFEFMIFAEENDYGSEYSTSSNSEIETIQNYKLSNEDIYKQCMPWYLEDFTYDMTNVLYDMQL